MSDVLALGVGHAGVEQGTNTQHDDTPCALFLFQEGTTRRHHGALHAVRLFPGGVVGKTNASARLIMHRNQRGRDGRRSSRRRNTNVLANPELTEHPLGSVTQ